ncbi:MAG: hypothetical protein ACXAB4_13990 [Candidatus Hodarchaeales archaeon]|jgi:hypothetical protein
MLKKDGLVRAREAAQSMMQHLKDMRTINNMVEEVRARIMIINTELHVIKQDTENQQQQAINEATKKLQDSQDERKEFLQQIRTLQDTTIQLETERELFQHLLRKQEEEKAHLEEQLGYLTIQLDLDRAFLEHQAAVQSTPAPTSAPEAESEAHSIPESAILQALVEKVFDGQLHKQILSTLWEATSPIPIEDIKENYASDPLFNRALMELKARNIIKVDKEGTKVSLAFAKDSELEE